MNDVLEIVSIVLVVGGAVFVLIGGIGIRRFPDLYSRMHAVSVTDAMGPLLILSGLMIEAGWSLASAKLFLILVFFLFTTPTASYALANAVTLSKKKYSPSEEQSAEG